MSSTAVSKNIIYRPDTNTVGSNPDTFPPEFPQLALKHVRDLPVVWYNYFALILSLKKSITTDGNFYSASPKVQTYNCICRGIASDMNDSFRCDALLSSLSSTTNYANADPPTEEEMKLAVERLNRQQVALAKPERYECT